MSDTSRIIDLLPRLAELHLQQCLSRGLAVPGGNVCSFRVGGVEGWAGALLCPGCLSPPPKRGDPAGGLRDKEWIALAELTPCCCQHQPWCSLLVHPSARWAEGQRGEAQPLREVSKLLPLAAPRSWTCPGSCGWCSQATAHFSLDCPAVASLVGWIMQEMLCVKHQKCWAVRRVLSVYELICG